MHKSRVQRIKLFGFIVLGMRNMLISAPKIGSGFLLRQGFAGRAATPLPPLSHWIIEIIRINNLFSNKQKPHRIDGVIEVAPVGIEPTTQGFSVPCSTD